MANQLKISKATGNSKEDYIKELKNEGYSTFEWSDSPGAYYPPHSHEHDECICVVNGKTTFIVGGSEYTLTKGDKLYPPRNTSHESKNKFDNKVTYLIGEK